MQPPDIRNLTIPKGLKVFFDDGSGMRDLGYMTGLDLVSKTDEFKHKSNRSGELRTVKTFIIGQELMFNFTLHEPVVNNMLAFMRGGAVESVGAGTGTENDQVLALAGELLASVDKYGISAVTVRQFLNYVFRKEAGGTFHNNSVEADSLAGTPFDFLTLETDEAYLGKNTKFKEFYSDLAVNGSYTGLAVKYWNGTAWAAVSNLAGAGAGFDADGKVQFDLPGDWVKKEVNGVSAYFLQITATAVTTPATVNCFRQNLVKNTDYVVDPGQVSNLLASGRIGRLASGMLADGEEVKVSYTYTTWTSLKFPMLTSGFKEGAARIEVHPAAGNGLQWNIHLTKCQLKPNGDLKLGDDQKSLDIPMQLETLDDSERYPDAPFGSWEPLSE